MLHGNKDPRLLQVIDPHRVQYRWFRLKTVKNEEDIPTWSRDADLEEVIKLSSTKIFSGIEEVHYYKLRRDLDDQCRLHILYDGNRFSLQRAPELVNEARIPLEGVWGRGGTLNVSDDF